MMDTGETEPEKALSVLSEEIQHNFNPGGFMTITEKNRAGCTDAHL